MEWTNDLESYVSYEEAVGAKESRILFVGPRRSGKTSIERVIFHKMSPHETLFLESTQNVDLTLIANNNFVRFQSWDFGGDINVQSDVQYDGRKISIEKVFESCSSLIYVIDAQEEDFEDALPKLVETILAAHQINPQIHFEVFLHKVDGDSMTDESKAERQNGVQQYVSSELENLKRDVLVSYHSTSIYDHSALEAFSKVVQKLVPQLPTLNKLLDILISSCNIEKSYLVDIKTKLYIATDSSPVDTHMYELCADLVDVVIDVSYIYGVNQLSPDSPSKKPNKESKHRTDNHQNGSSLHAILEAPYDEASTSAIKLNNGMVLYLRYVSDYLALVCIIRENYFARRSLLDYNIDCLKASLFKVIQVAKGL